jgi:hypothetical protein
VANWGNYTETYGLIGAVMILLSWFYISGLVILVGAEMNAEIEHASPRGKDPGEKVAGQKRRISWQTMRRWIGLRRAHGEKPPSADEVKAALSSRAPDHQSRDTSAHAIGAPSERPEPNR